jgi:hypothetical protein
VPLNGVMAAIEQCRTAALGGHVERCPDCGHTQIAYNSCPKCQGAVAKQWLAAREADLLPVAYYHVVFTLPAPDRASPRGQQAQGVKAQGVTI